MVPDARSQHAGRRARRDLGTVADYKFEVAVFTDLFARARDLLEVGSMLLIEVSVQRQENLIRLVAQTISKLDEQEGGRLKGFCVYLGLQTRLETLSAVIAREQAGVGRVAVVQPFGDDLEVEVELPGRYAATPAFRAALKSVPGVVEVLDI